MNQISIDDLRPLVEYAFTGDRELIEKYHITGGSLKDCVDSTMEAIMDVNNVYGLKCYDVYLFADKIGYATFGPEFLHSFGINIKFRTKEILNDWWKLMNKIMSDFFCTLHSKNTRAINFLKRQGMIVHSEGENLINLITCQ